MSLQFSSFESNLFALVADTTGGPPTTFSWRRNGASLINDNSYNISIMADPNDTQDGRVNCLYRSTLHVTGILPGIYEYRAENRATSGVATGSFTIEGMAI